MSLSLSLSHEIWSFFVCIKYYGSSHFRLVDFFGMIAAARAVSNPLHWMRAKHSLCVSVIIGFANMIAHILIASSSFPFLLVRFFFLFFLALLVTVGTCFTLGSGSFVSVSTRATAKYLG